MWPRCAIWKHWVSACKDWHEVGGLQRVLKDAEPGTELGSNEILKITKGELDLQGGRQTSCVTLCLQSSDEAFCSVWVGGIWTVSYNVPGNFQVLKCPVPPMWSLSQLKPFSSPWLVLSQTRKHSGRGWERYLQLFILFFFLSSSLSLYSFDLLGTEQGERSGSGKVEMLFHGQQRCDLQMFSGS